MSVGSDKGTRGSDSAADIGSGEDELRETAAATQQH